MKSYNLTDLSNRILRHFIHIEEVLWIFKGEKRVPSQSEIKDMLERASASLDEDNNASSVTIGGIHVNRYEDSKDVYVYIGTLDEEK